MLFKLLSETGGPARTFALAAVALAAVVSGCAGQSGELAGSAAGDPGRPRAESIGGTVWVDENGDGQYSMGETTTSGATVTLWQDSNGDGLCGAGDLQVGTTVTGEDGAYLFGSLAAGSYCVQVGTGAAATMSTPVAITPDSGQTLNVAIP